MREVDRECDGGCGLVALHVVAVQLLSHVRLCDLMDCSMPGSSLHYILEFAQIHVQLSHPYMTTGKTIALTRRTFVSKVMSLLFHMLSRFVTAFLPRSKHLLISWLQALSAVFLEPKKRKSVTASNFPPSICHEVIDWMP